MVGCGFCSDDVVLDSYYEYDDQRITELAMKIEDIRARVSDLEIFEGISIVSGEDDMLN